MTAGQNHSSTSHAVTCYRAFTEIPDSLVDRWTHGNAGGFFNSIDWFRCIARYGFAQRPGLRLLVCHDRGCDDESPFLICLREDARRRRLSSLSNFYTIKYPGVAGPHEPPEYVLRAIMDAVASESPAWSEIELRNLSAADPTTDAMCAALERAGYRVDLSHQYWNWFTKVDGLSYEAYLAGRPSRLQNTLRRRGRQAAARHRVRFADFHDGSHLAAGLAGYLQVYDRSWKQPETLPDFVPALIRLCATLGILRLGILYLDDIPVATQFWICSDGVSYIYKLSQDPDYDALSVGSLLTAHMFEQAIDVDKVSEIDFGTGDEAFKQDWTDARRQFVGLQAINRRTLRGSLRSLQLSIRDSLRRAGLREYTPVRLNSDASDYSWPRPSSVADCYPCPFLARNKLVLFAPNGKTNNKLSGISPS